MARSYGAILCAIWSDPEFCSLSSDAQRTYLMLVTQPDISACGSLSLTLRRWANTLPETDRDRLVPSLKELSQHRFVLIDHDTEELFVRTFPKHDGGYKHAQRVKAVIAYAEAIRSDSLRTAVAVELQKLGVSIATQVAPGSDSTGNRVAIDSHPGYPQEETGTSEQSRLSIGTEQAVESGRVVVTEVSIDPQPLTRNREPAPPSGRCKRQHPDEQACGQCRADRLADEAAGKLDERRKRHALERNDAGMAELDADLAKPIDPGAFAAARDIFKATLTKPKSDPAELEILTEAAQ